MNIANTPYVSRRNSSNRGLATFATARFLASNALAKSGTIVDS